LLPVFGGGGGGVTFVVTGAGVGAGVAQFPAFTPQTGPDTAKLRAEPSPPAQPDKAVDVANTANNETKRIIHIHTDPDLIKYGPVVLILR
jgi:hypothetical protein